MFKLLVGLCGAKQKLWLQCSIIYFLLERQTVLKLFALSFYTNCLFFLIVLEFLEYQKYGECSDYYRLSCLRQILFLMHCFAHFDETIDFYWWYKPWKSYITLATMQKQNMKLFAIVLRVVICFIILTDLTELSVEFCVDEVFEDRGCLDVRRRRRGKSSSLVCPRHPK